MGWLLLLLTFPLACVMAIRIVFEFKKQVGLERAKRQAEAEMQQKVDELDAEQREALKTFEDSILNVVCATHELTPQTRQRLHTKTEAEGRAGLPRVGSSTEMTELDFPADLKVARKPIVLTSPIACIPLIARVASRITHHSSPSGGGGAHLTPRGGSAGAGAGQAARWLVLWVQAAACSRTEVARPGVQLVSGRQCS